MGSRAGDSELEETLEALELQENTCELDDMVCEVREELNAAKKAPSVPRIAGGRPISSASLPRVGVHGKAQSNHKADLVIKPVPSTVGCSSGEAHFVSVGDAHHLGSVGNGEEVKLKHCFDAMMARLSRLEHRLEEWSLEHRRLLERSLHGRVHLPPRGSEWQVVKEEWAEHPGARDLKHQDSHARGELPHGHPAPQDENEHMVRLQSSRSMRRFRSAGGSVRSAVRSSRLSARTDPSHRFSDSSAPWNGRPPSAEELQTAEQLREQRLQKRSQLMSSDSIGQMPPPTAILTFIVTHPAFDYFFATLIMLNSLFIGVQTEYRVHTIGATTEPRFFSVAEKVFAAFFIVELAMRMVAMKRGFFHPKVLSWNVFDMVLVIMSIIEIVLNIMAGDADAADASGNAGKVIRMFRMARIVRIMRVLRFLAELRIMVTLIMHSARALFWLMILLVIILYIFSIFFTQGVTDYLNGSSDPPTADVLQTNYGSIGLSAFTLFAAITGGVSWRDVMMPLAQTGWVFSALFLIYVFFCVFSVLNIVTGVFVDGAIQRSSQERDLRLEKEKEQKKMYVSMLMDLLEEIDAEGTGVITREELEEAFKSEQVRYYFSVLDIDVVDSNYLFDMLDLDRSGEVDMEEFVSGCLRLKGNAKSIDIHTLMFEIKLMIKQMNNFMDCYVTAAATGGQVGVTWRQKDLVE